MAEPIHQLDDVDRRIIELLREDGRTTNQDIAQRLGLAAATVSSRIKRMEESNALRVVAVSDFAAHAYDVLIQLSIEVEGRPSAEVGRAIAELPEVFAAHLVTGEHELDVLLALSGVDRLADLSERLSAIEGIRKMTPSFVLDIVKYDFEIAPITSEAGRG